MRKKGMSLNELIMVVLVVSVIAALSIPTFQRTAEKVRGDDALAILRLLRAAEKVYYFDWGQRYVDLTVAAPGPLVTEGYLQNPNGDSGRAFNYTIVSVVSPPTFVATAARISGCNSGETRTLNQTGTVGGTWTPRCP